MNPHRSTTLTQPGSPRSLRGLAAFAVLAGTISGCSFIRDAIAPPPPPSPPTELSRGPSPVFDDEVRPGGGPLALGRKDQEPAARKEPLPATPGLPSSAGGKKAFPAGSSRAAGAAGDAGLVTTSAGPMEASPQPSIRSAPRDLASGAGSDPDDRLEDLFQSLRQKFTAASTGTATDQYAAIERADLEAKLIAIFFIRDRKKIEDYRDLIRSFREDSLVNVEVELLKAALYQKVGQADLRDRALERIREATASSAGTLRLAGLSFAKEIRGYRTFTPLSAAEFGPGEEALIYGEIEGFRSTPLASGARSTHRRSFAAELVLRDGAGAEVDRRELLRAGQAVEVVEDPAKPVHFWGRYPIPAQLNPGSYRIEIEVQDIEAQRRVKGRLMMKIRS